MGRRADGPQRDRGRALHVRQEHEADGGLPAALRATGSGRCRGRERVPRPADQGARGDEFIVHFKNLDNEFERPHSMHFHGVGYQFGSDGSFIPGFLCRGGDVMPGNTFTYQLARARTRPALALPRPLAVDDGLDRGRMYGAVSILPQGDRAPTASSSLLRVPPRLRDDQRARVRRQHAGAAARASATACSGTCSRSATSTTPSTSTATAGATRRHLDRHPRPSARPSRFCVPHQGGPARDVALPLPRGAAHDGRHDRPLPGEE